MVIYEWSDVEYLGKPVATRVDEDDFYPAKTYVCTSDAVRANVCDTSQLGRFIIDLPSGKALNSTSFYTARVGFGSESNKPSNSSTIAGSGNGFWDNPDGNPDIPDEDLANASPWKRDDHTHDTNESPSDILWYKEPIQYHVSKTGYYCVAIVPVTVLDNSNPNSTDVPFHPHYNGKILFRNTFDGQLPATDYPKVTFYFSMFLVYTVLGAAWGFLCYKHKDDLLPIQYYLSGLVGFLIIEMVANWVYYRYLNAHGRGTASTAFLFVVAILDAGRNALSFFMLLVVSLGLSVVRESLGRTMLRCQLLTAAHFIFGVLYAVGVVELELESTSAVILLLFVIPLAFTLSGFLLWILYSLNGTITELQVRKQRYKLQMFTRLYRILWLTVVVIAIFFVVSSLSFSERLQEDYAANSWKSRWWLLDGWLSLLYLIAFWSIAYLWRPTGSNRRLAMSDELAQDEADAEDYDLESLQRRDLDHPGHDDDDDAATLVGGRRPTAPADDRVVFEIGDEHGSDEEDDDPNKNWRGVADDEDRAAGGTHEREGLIGAGNSRKDD